MTHFRCIAPGQEVLAETTYPADQTVGLALMSLFGFVKVNKKSNKMSSEDPKRGFYSLI